MGKFNIGDVVYLKSGSPAMTINRLIEERGNVECVWFVENEQKQFIFNEDTLIPKDPKSGFIEVWSNSERSSF
ncbi:DUF2158 domain-containing protein [Acinetobacter bereziniae]|uniref:DUF2158 domain-containing protein n=1 Tax=Acinetobacter bereziniae LMG 1003 = CIP 70.12 TaxID=981324 RepID=N9F067_ACIBZ|nr:DUF2158 domain-containing protein [Acinetobacter bereziniae]ENV98320.1 hypothetical protein F938_01174 [Acinetobacter bereziniae LMG 1003 = CIP 70.12]MBJ9908532.1 DUF2158 domain-containing protein [Acinetobacter bereziniae]MBJ9929841.1 DUF2158 domain-containing protein [Acinetobacter bereziniae]MDG3558515.1 DUF2158 domain-containing protein [Acinetobacter bereziniae]MDP6003563.1 DUF2158 domain-containing protein [Acinetobacter bereziniae]